MRPPREPSHEASTQASVVRYVQFSHPFLFMHTLQFVTYLQLFSPRENYKKAVDRGASPRCVKEKRGGGVQPANTFCSATGSSVDSKGVSPAKKTATTVDAPPTAPNP